ncbi:MAG: hypothetical protein J2P15_20135, partial [Micromonosporaceae bacterium]|nr:hypothetical protein [Micromonosporaceae bacterium]
IHRALSTVLSRVGVALADRGLRHVVLDADGLRQALAVGFGPEMAIRQPGTDARAGRPGRRLREAWTAWLGPAATHVCFAVRHWPAKPPQNLLTALGQIQDALAVTVAVTVRGRSAPASPATGQSGRVATHTLIRVVAPPSVAETCARRVRVAAARLGIHLRRLNGEHAAGVYATVPNAATIGGGPW